MPSTLFKSRLNQLTRAVSTTALLLLIAPQIGANIATAVPRPVLKVRSDQNVSLKIILKQKTHRRARKAQVDVVAYRTDETGRTAPIAVIADPARREVVTDTPPHSGRYTYHVTLERVDRRVRSSRRVRTKVKINESSTLSSQSSVTPPTPASFEMPAGYQYCPVGLTQRSLDEINHIRSLRGLHTLQSNLYLTLSAYAHTAFNADHNRLTHEGWFERIIGTGYSGKHYAQNLASYIQDPVVLVHALMESPGHAGNIVNPNFRVVGIACLVDASGKYWWAQNFGDQG